MLNIYRIKITALRVDGLTHVFYEDVITDSEQSAMDMVSHYRTTQPAPIEISFEHFDHASYLGPSAVPDFKKKIRPMEYLSHPSTDVMRLRAKNIGYKMEIVGGQVRFYPNYQDGFLAL